MNAIQTYFCVLFIISNLNFGAGGRYANAPGSRGRNSPRRATTPRSREPSTRHTSTSRPITTARPFTTARSITTARPITTARGVTTARAVSTSPIYVTGSSSSKTAGWDLPPRPGSAQQQFLGYQGPNKIKIENHYNYHYPGYYSLPVQSNHPGYYYAPTTYHYSSFDTGSTALGFFMGYSLAKLTTPTYSHYSFYDGYTPRYDHYTVHHYYHNLDSVPPKQNIPANAIVGCVGDSATVCPGNTTSLCTSEGALMCVVSATSTVPCTNDRQLNCVKSTIPCVNNTAPECKNSNQDVTSVNIPCISTAEVYGEVKYVNNTIIVEDANTNNTTTSTERTTEPETTTDAKLEKRSTEPQNFCVAVLALPAKKEETEGEKLFKDVKEVASQFFENVFGV